jgi:dGTPase
LEDALTAFKWENLLSKRRVRDLYDGPASQRIGGDSRTPFDQDYGRAVFSTPVRRLQDKAQVFPLEAHDSVRTRLTHSLEVSSIARGLGEHAENFVRDQKNHTKFPFGSIPTIAATCGLIHDIGNPPFGHAGEKAIGSWFESRKEIFDDFPGDDKLASQYALDFLRFEGNAQTQRLLSSLQILADKFGLNLTCATLSASLKYVVPSNQRDDQRAEAKKHGFFASENDLIRRIKDEVGVGQSRHPVAFIVEAADDIAYATVDLEDGIKKRCLDWETLERELLDLADDETVADALRYTKAKIGPANLAGKTLDEAMSVSFRTNAIIQMVKAAALAFERNYDAIMTGNYHKSLLSDSAASHFVKACKSIAAKHVYSAPQTLKLELMGRKVIWDLLNLYWEAAQWVGSNARPPEFATKGLALMSSNYQNVCATSIAQDKDSGAPADYYRMQLITDQVCGMTDTFAVTLHRELTNG